MPNEEEQLEAVNISDMEKKTEEATEEEEEASLPSQAEDATTTPSPNNTDTQEALSKLKVSTAKLGTAIKRASIGVDERIGLSRGVGKLNESVRQVDTERGVSETVKRGSATVGGWFSSLDQKLQISQRTLEIKGALGEKVKPMTDNVGESLAKSKRNLQVFDETHGITKTTASTLASGADLLAGSIGGGEIEDGNDVAPESLELDKDDDSKPV